MRQQSRDDLVVEAAGKIEQAGFDVLDLHADGVDLGDALADPLQMGFHLGPLLCDLTDIDAHSAGEVDAAGEVREAGLDLFGGLLAFNGALQQRLQHGEK